MIVTKGIRLIKIISWTGFHALWLTLFCSAVALLYKYGHINFYIPWVAISVIGTAVAFYLGFKNNSAYDRLWEARKIWGAIVNSSRAWGTYVNGYINTSFGDSNLPDEEVEAIKKRLVHRHIAWLYALRGQLLKIMPWEHAGQDGFIGKTAEYYKENFGIGLVEDKITETELRHYLSDEENEYIHGCSNMATQIIDLQTRDLAKLYEQGLVDNFRHVEMGKLLYDFYVHQGKCERIKKFPLPRQYANMSRIFVGIFIALLPFGMIPELLKIGEWGYVLSVPVTCIIGWVYVVMEIIGDYTENPFQGMANDIPMLSLCRGIEIDLREMMGEDDIPQPIESKNGILM